MARVRNDWKRTVKLATWASRVATATAVLVVSHFNASRLLAAEPQRIVAELSPESVALLENHRQAAEFRLKQADQQLRYAEELLDLSRERVNTVTLLATIVGLSFGAVALASAIAAFIEFRRFKEIRAGLETALTQSEAEIVSLKARIQDVEREAQKVAALRKAGATGWAELSRRLTAVLPLPSLNFHLLGDKGAAEDDNHRALLLDSDSVVLAAAAFGFMNESIQESSDLLVRLSGYWRRRDDIARAKNRIDQALALTPRSPHALEELARILTHEENPASDDVQRALVCLSDAENYAGEPRPSTIMTRATVLKKYGKLRQALDATEPLVSPTGVSPGQYLLQLHWNRACLQTQLELFDQALESIEAAQSAAKSHAERRLLARALDEDPDIQPLRDGAESTARVKYLRTQLALDISQSDS